MSHIDSSEYWADVLRKNMLIAARLDGETETEETINEAILSAPRRGTARDALAREIASMVYPNFSPESLGPIIQYEKDIVKLRSLAERQRKNTVAKATDYNERHNWNKRILKQQGPWNEIEDLLSLVPSLPMPVEVSDPESLAPFFAHIRNNGTHEQSHTIETANKGVPGAEPYYNVEYIEFEKGVLYSDGRIDLCKMVTGPRNIGDLMNSLKSNTASKHFLLGNNITGPTGADAIASFIEEFPHRIETWYLGANCFDAASFARLAESMVKSPVITNVWLKRNPLGPTSAKDIFRLITQSPSLRTLDLDQTELGDGGATELFALLADHDQALPLRHLYLNATGISKRACEQISRYLALPSCALSSLFLSNNPIGTAAAALAPGLASNRTLERLSLQSCGLSDVPTATLLSALRHHRNIRALDFGQSYSTEDLGMRYNWLTDSAPFVDLVQTSSSLQYLNISYAPMSQESVNVLLQAVSTSPSMLSLERQARPLLRGDPTAVRAGQEGVRLTKLVRDQLQDNVLKQCGVDYEEFNAEHKRFLTSPPDVRLIDSVYRNRAAGQARRGLAKLDKVWADGDETLRMVAGDAPRVTAMMQEKQ
jgi:Ran GTPase-activating protein (RanGAP) involved in mRNA processing and transport